MLHRSWFVIFYFKEKFCVSARVCKTCEMFIAEESAEDLVEKIISGSIWLKSFIQTVKCFSSNQIIVYQSFCGELFTFSYFLLQRKVLCFASCISKSVTCEMFISEASKELVETIYLRL